MTNPASPSDLADRWRPLSEQETINGQTFLDDAWRMLKRKFDGLETSIATDADQRAEVVRVLATAVLRVMKNPDGKRQEAIDDYSWTRDQAMSAGLLYFTDDEIDAISNEPETRSPAFTFSLLPANYPASRWP